MTGLLARQFQVSKLELHRLKKLHAMELRMKRHLTPAEIREKATAVGEDHIPPHGDIQGERIGPLESAVWRQYVKCRADVFDELDREGGPAEPWQVDVAILHSVDMAVRNLGLDFSPAPTAKSRGVLGRINQAKTLSSKDMMERMEPQF